MNRNHERLAENELALGTRMIARGERPNDFVRIRDVDIVVYDNVLGRRRAHPGFDVKE